MSDELLPFDEVVERFDPVLGLEVHVELSTASKMWCGCPTDFGGEPNSHVCPVCLGLPGSLPVLNRKAVESAIRIGLSLNCEIAKWCRFARKNYFYPDMPKDYQVSQYDEPLCFDGGIAVEVGGVTYQVPIERVHMEEDAGKLTHVGGVGRISGADYSLLDYNRAGVPLMEVVTKTIHGTGAAAPEVASGYLAFLRDMVRALGVSEARMERGNLRCDVNVSLSPKGSDVLGIRSETKNVNSLKAVTDAVRYEMQRQGAILTAGGRVKQETRHWNEGGYTTPGRSKETAEDYRYFPEPDLVPVAPDPAWVEELRTTRPEHPAVRRARLAAEWGFTPREFGDILASEGALDLIAETVDAGCSPASARKWWLTELARRANETGVTLPELPITPREVAEVQALVETGSLNDSLARQVIAGVLAGEGSPAAVVQLHGLAVTSDAGALQAAIAAAIADNPEIAAKVRSGKPAAAGALIGAVMRTLHGQADAAKVRELVLAQLSES
ncbi:MAG: Asp-tRNA(Asn)/Glu-tRNA(Gln) amidotransferase subunit GatB [Propionibacteriaceae bacterium]|jgi:aspartyl-tRNA(Asn)/glutamyl-tRNA(Gln) amidotransferase subunit B|nr:Asp-tRNA(Asn)/Glu-tRNA(Gln) amidotransferase subunit GatB [Propionibacteriaceae bacterium]